MSKALAAALLVGAAWAAQELVSAERFDATSVVVSGNSLVPAEDVAGLLDIGRPNVFQLRARHLEAMVETHPTIRYATVRPSLLGTVFVHVEERVPVLVWEASGQSVLTDADGLALQDAAAYAFEEVEGDKSLPVIHAAGNAVPIGGRVDPVAVRTVRAVAPALRSLRLGDGRLEYQPGTGVSIAAPSHRIILGSPDQIEAKLDAYRAIRRHLEEHRISAQIIDLRSPDRPYFR